MEVERIAYSFWTFRSPYYPDEGHLGPSIDTRGAGQTTIPGSSRRFNPVNAQPASGYYAGTYVEKEHSLVTPNHVHARGPTLRREPYGDLQWHPQGRGQSRSGGAQAGRPGRGMGRPGNEENRRRGSPAVQQLIAQAKPMESAVLDFNVLRGHIIEIAADQYGSRVLQERLPSATADELDLVVSELHPAAFEVATDVFGNYLFQKLLTVALPRHQIELVRQLQPSLLKLALHSYGCRVVQRLIEVLPEKTRSDLLQHLLFPRSVLLQCIHDQHGNHVS